MHIQTQGLVLRETDYKEHGKLLTVLTRDAGKCTVSARGVRRGSHKLMAASQFLVYSNMTLFVHKGRYSLDEAEVLETFSPLRQELSALSLAAYLAELTGALSGEEADPALLDTLLRALLALARQNRLPLLVKAAAEWKLMALSGYRPTVDVCARCGAVPPKDPALSQGLILCAHCREAGEQVLPLGENARLALRHILAGEEARLFSFSLPEEDLQRLAEAGEHFVTHQLEQSFKTLIFYKKVTI